MKFCLAILLAGFCCCAARAQFDPLTALTVQSMSGQFTVVSASSRVAPPSTNDANYVWVEPNRLAVSCERIKQGLWQLLDVKGPWQGKVMIVLRPAGDSDEPVTITSNRSRDGWNYHVEMPDRLPPARVVRAVVNVLVLEQANRRASEHAADVPQWLTEGLTQQLLAAPKMQLVLSQPLYNAHGVNFDYTDVSGVMKDPLADAIVRLRQHPALTFQELSWPAGTVPDSEEAVTYRASAQLFVMQLLQLENGPAELRDLLDKLPDYYNWQPAFLNVFGAQFSRLIDVEKWWALQIVNFTQRDLNRLWTRDETWEKLDEIIRTSVDISTVPGQSTGPQDVSLQRLIRQWDYPRQKQSFNQKIQQLAYLRQFAAPELAGLVDDYREVLDSYLKERDRAGGNLTFGKGLAANSSIAVARTLNKLDALESRRAGLGPQLVPVATNNFDRGR